MAFSLMVDTDFGGQRQPADKWIAEQAEQDALPVEQSDDERQQAALAAHLAKLGVQT